MAKPGHPSFGKNRCSGFRNHQFQTGLGPGDYYVRLGVVGSSMGDWKAYQVAGADLVAEYDFEGNALDNSAYLNHGVSQWTTPATGHAARPTPFPAIFRK